METKISVLLADPGEQYRAAYSKAIGQETDMELVAQTDNGLRAEELITKFQPDVVVLDLVLPNLDGLSLLTHLRAKNASSRVIVTSAICNDQVLMECAELGTTYFMQKPFDPPLLVQRIRQTARPRQRTGGAAPPPRPPVVSRLLSDPNAPFLPEGVRTPRVSNYFEVVSAAGVSVMPSSARTCGARSVSVASSK